MAVLNGCFQKVSAPDRAGGRFAAAVCLALLVVILAVYAPVGRYGFLDFDDDVYVSKNAHVLAGFTSEGLAWAVTSVGYAANWHPLTWLSHMADVEVFGLRAGGHHLANVLIHAANAIVLFLLFWRMTGALRASAFIAALFAVHPLNVESVAWVAERKNVLSTFFLLLTLASYVRFVRRPSWNRYLLTLLSFALGLLSKPMLVTLPFVLLLLDVWPLGRLDAFRSHAAAEKPGRAFPGRHVLLEKVPLLCLSIGSALLTFVAQTRGGLVGSLRAYPFPQRAANAVLAYVDYAWKMIWPAKLAFFYPHRADALPLGATVASGLLLAALSLALILARRRYPCLGVGWFWYLGTLVPVIGLVQVGSQGMADRYAYVPLVGLYLAIAWGTDRLARAWRVPSAALTLAAGATLLCLALIARGQVGFWRDGSALVSHTLAVTEGNWFAENNYGVFLDRQGKRDEAITHYAKALAIRPSFSQAHNNWGAALASQKRLGEAIDHYREAIRLMPDSATAFFNLGAALAGQGKFEEALADYSRALILGSEKVATHFSMGVVLESLRKSDEAARHYREVLRFAPGHRAARARLERIEQRG
ncbi:MAG: tetratricopeptide repeat protein [Candidatus Methylomirabilia bacterium]